MRSPLLVALLAAGSMMPFGGGGALADPDTLRAGKSLELVVSQIGRLKAAVQLCGYGGIEPWNAIIEAIDRRYARCMAEDSRWSKIMVGWEEDAREATSHGLSAGIGSLGSQSYFRSNLEKARKMGIATYCDSFPWKWVLNADPDSGKAKADYVKADPQGQVSMLLTVFDGIAALGRDLKWVDAPCDTNFW